MVYEKGTRQQQRLNITWLFFSPSSFKNVPLSPFEGKVRERTSILIQSPVC
jgi:hypothetical protein